VTVYELTPSSTSSSSSSSSSSSCQEVGPLAWPVRASHIQKSLQWFSPVLSAFDVFGLTLLWARNPFRGKSHHSQVSRTYVMVRIKDIIILIASLVKFSSFGGSHCHIPSSSSTEKYTHGFIENLEGKEMPRRPWRWWEENRNWILNSENLWEAWLHLAQCRDQTFMFNTMWGIYWLVKTLYFLQKKSVRLNWLII